jgi:magnesium-transporting ATPase (P-type)
MAYSGTVVSVGQAQGVVVATGRATEIGRIGTMVGEVATLATPLTRRLDQFALRISLFIVVVGLITFAYGYFWRGLPLLDIFLAVVALAVAAIPEGLPAIVTIVLAIGTRSMARNKAIVRRLPAVETLGSVTVICSDKTGTLTKNEMTAVRVMLSDRTLQVSGAGYAPEGGFLRDGEAVDAEDDAAAARTGALRLAVQRRAAAARRRRGQRRPGRRLATGRRPDRRRLAGAGAQGRARCA